MELQTNIRKELWSAIESTYKAENYSHAIVDAWHYLRDTVREKTGLDGDGHSLIGNAFGGENPRLRINRLETETERNEQKGMEQLLRGIFQGIRSPRSHEKNEDEKNTADAIVFFVDYLVSVIDKSEEAYSIARFLERVYEPLFVDTKQYARLLINEIPKNKKFDTLVEIYRNKNSEGGEKIKHIVNGILRNVSNSQVNEFLGIVSEELKMAQDNVTIINTLRLLSPSYWLRVDKAARIRIENKLLKSIEEGEVNPTTGRLYEDLGDFGTWAKTFIPYFELKSEVAQIFIQKLEDDDAYDRAYIAIFFMGDLPKLLPKKNQKAKYVSAISKAIKTGDSILHRELVKWIDKFPEDVQKLFSEELKDLSDHENPGTYLSDGTPFLSSGDIEEEIPF